MRPFGIAALSGCVATAAVAHAETKGITLEQICPTKSGVARFDPTSLMIAAVDLNPPSRQTLDIDGDGSETEVERLTIVMKNPCSDKGSTCAADKGKIVAIHSSLLAIFSRGDVTISRRRGPPTADEIKREPWLQAKPEEADMASVAELLDPQGRFVSVTCDLPKPAERSVQVVDADTAPPPKAKLRVTSKLEELSRAGGQKLKNVDAAALSIEKDTVGDKLTFGIDAIVGVSFQIGSRPDSLIPFVQYQRTSVRDSSTSPATTKKSPDKLGLGAVVGLHVARYDDVNIAPIYVADYEKGSRVTSVKSNWIPSFLRNIDPIPVMRSRPLIPGLIFWGLTPRLLAQGSHVFDAGSNRELMDTSNFFRIGGDITLDLWGDGRLKALTGSVAYKRLARLGSGPEGIHFLKTNLQYWLDPSQHVSVGYTFEHGLDEDTITKVNDWKVSVGVRF